MSLIGPFHVWHNNAIHVTLESTLITGLPVNELIELPIVSFWKAREIEEKLVQQHFSIILILFYTKAPNFNSFQCDFEVGNYKVAQK